MAVLPAAKSGVINVGLASFAPPIIGAGAKAAQVDWRPPAAGDAGIGRRLAAITAHPRIEAANRRAFGRYLAARPVLTGLAAARDAVPGLADRTILHAGPPIAWEEMCGPMRGGVLGAIVHEGWAADIGAAEALAARGDIRFAPCHHHDAVGPMAGLLTPSMPVWVVENAEHGNRAYCTLNEGLGKVLRYGANGAEALARLAWMRDALAPALGAAVDRLGGIELKPLIGQALHMGDELHNRNVAATSLLFRRLVPALLETGLPAGDLTRVASFLTGNDHFFLNLSMAACKAMLDAAHGVAGSSMVTAMARNGVHFGIRVSGMGARWFEAPAPAVKGLFFPGYGPADANPDLGDSTITETAGLGGFSMAAAPAIVQFVGGSAGEARANSREMRQIAIGSNDAFTLPSLEFAGAAAGIDARKVVDTGILPAINTGIAHREPGVGQVGAGLTRAPLDCFVQAVAALADEVERPSPTG